MAGEVNDQKGVMSRCVIKGTILFGLAGTAALNVSAVGSSVI